MVKINKDMQTKLINLVTNDTFGGFKKELSDQLKAIMLKKAKARTTKYDFTAKQLKSGAVKTSNRVHVMGIPEHIKTKIHMDSFRGGSCLSASRYQSYATVIFSAEESLPCVDSGSIEVKTTAVANKIMVRLAEIRDEERGFRDELTQVFRTGRTLKSVYKAMPHLEKYLEEVGTFSKLNDIDTEAKVAEVIKRNINNKKKSKK